MRAAHAADQGRSSHRQCVWLSNIRTTSHPSRWWWTTSSFPPPVRAASTQPLPFVPASLFCLLGAALRVARPDSLERMTSLDFTQLNSPRLESISHICTGASSSAASSAMASSSTGASYYSSPPSRTSESGARTAAANIATLVRGSTSASSAGSSSSIGTSATPSSL